MFSYCPFNPGRLEANCVEFNLQLISFNHIMRGGGQIDWQVFAYTVQDKMSARDQVVTRLWQLAKQTDEGNLSCVHLQSGRYESTHIFVNAVSHSSCHGEFGWDKPRRRSHTGYAQTRKPAENVRQNRVSAPRIMINGQMAL